MRLTRILVSIAVAFALAAPASADEDPGYTPGPWHYKAVTCVDTTITFVGPRLESAAKLPAVQAMGKYGVIVAYATGLGIAPLFPHGTAEIVHYQGDTGNGVMSAERKGDRVQLCYLGGPAPHMRCDPDRDNRGRSYRAYDYRQHEQYWGQNSEHDCGGA